RVDQAEGHLIAGEPIFAEALVLEARGEIFAESLDFAETLEGSSMPWPSELYFLRLGDTARHALDVSRAGSLARLVTHSPEPNCGFQAWLVDGRPRNGVYALCGIAQGAVLTADY
ncbi:hypothetical protein T492DRAFT_571480, partial [Pavlovales sp. CCMP2436]